MAKDFSIDAASIFAMYQYCKLTPGIIHEIAANINTLFMAFESESKNLITDHREKYHDLLAECKELLQTITGEISDSTSELLRKAAAYEEAHSKKL